MITSFRVNILIWLWEYCNIAYLGCRIPILLPWRHSLRLTSWFALLHFCTNWMWQIVWDEEGASVDVYPDRAELSWEESCLVVRWRWEFCISGLQLTIPMKRLELMGHMWVWFCHFHYYRHLTVWMNQRQQSHKPVYSGLWRLECLRHEQTPDTKMKPCQSSDETFVGWWLSNWFFILTDFSFSLDSKKMLACVTCSRSAYFIGSFASSGRCLASHLLLHPILQALRERSHESLALTSPPSLCQVLSNRGTRFYATKQKSCHCLLAKWNFPAPQETNYLLDCESFSSEVYSH